MNHMYLQNKYTKCYFSIINRSKERDLGEQSTEKHHIIPKSFGGGNESINIAVLTLREHFICHLLLPKMTEGKQRTKMVYAIWMMCRTSKSKRTEYKCTSVTYEKTRLKLAGIRTSSDFTPEWRAKISAKAVGRAPWNDGIKHTDASRKKMSETRKKLVESGLTSWNIGIPRTEKDKKKIKEANTGKQWVHNPLNPQERKLLDPNDVPGYLTIGWISGVGDRTIIGICPHCDKTMDVANLQKWHGDKCKYR